MTQYSPAIICALVEKEYPDVYQTLVTRLSESLPAKRLTDLLHACRVVNDLEDLLEIKGIDWTNAEAKVSYRIRPDEMRYSRVTDVRELLIAVLLLFYQPEKIYRYNYSPVKRSPAKQGLTKMISEITGISVGQLSHVTINTVSHFQSYKAFRADVQHLYQALNEKTDYFTAYGN